MKILVAFIFIFFVFNIYIFMVKPKVLVYQNQSQGNIVAAQEFIYNEKAPNIIVGSSMAARMKKEFLPSDYLNLSFGGGSALTGLEILKKSGFIPKTIFVENNVIFRNKDKKMIDSLFYPILWKIKNYLPSLQEKYQPLNIIVSYIKGAVGKSHDEYMNETVDQKIFRMSLERQVISYNNQLSMYEKELVELLELIDFFEKKGVKVIFFEVPIYDELSNSIRAIQQRTIIKENFSNKWLENPNNLDYETTDGIHMTYKSAFEYSKYFIQMAKAIK